MFVLRHFSKSGLYLIARCTEQTAFVPVRRWLSLSAVCSNGNSKDGNIDWSKVLSPEEYSVTQEKGTEPPFTGKYVTHKGTGIYKCVCCGSELFSSTTKFESGTGWPSFSDVCKSDSGAANVKSTSDMSLGMLRTEVTCKQCNAHLGHVFNDGPQPTGLRYCVNSIALDFKSNT